MNSNDRLINKTFLGIWAITGMSVLFNIACIMIDAIFTGQFLGADAVAASGLCTPVAMIVNLIGALFGPGVSISCTKFMGMAKKDMVNKTFSMIVEVLCGLSVVITILLFILAPVIAGALGAKAGNEIIITMASDYLRGYSLAVIPLSLSIAISGLMMLDNDRIRGIGTMLVTLICDFIFDYLNVAVFHGGMWGMAIASALSNLAGLIVVLTHFTKKNRVLSFYFTRPDMKLLKDVMVCGIPNSVSLASTAIRGLCFNAFMFAICGDVAVAALSASNSLFTIMNAIALGMFVATSSLSSLLYGEGDRSGIVKTLRISIKLVTIVFGSMNILVFIFPGIIARAFLDATAIEQLAQAAKFIRFMAIEYLFFISSYSFSGLYQGIQKNGLSNLIVILREAVLPIVFAISLGLIFGLDGFMYGLAIAGVMVTAACFLIPIIVNKKVSFSAKDMVLLPQDFGAGPDELFEASMETMEEVMKVSEEATEFCLGKNMTKRNAQMTALFIEETVGNSLTHVGPKGKPVHVDLRVIVKEDSQIIRIRDDGKPFDPVDWYAKNNPQDPASGLGIRLIMKLAKDVKYIPAMGLNNLMITM